MLGLPLKGARREGKDTEEGGTCMGVLTADNEVNPQISLKWIVTASNFSA